MRSPAGWWLALVVAASAAASAVPHLLQAADTGGLETRAAALILSGQAGGNLETRLLTLLLPGSSRGMYVALISDVPGDQLLRAEDDQDLLLELYVYALNRAGEVAGFITHAVRVEHGAHAGVIARGGVKFLTHLQLDPGSYSLRILVLDRRKEQFGLTVVPLTLPQAEDTPLLLPPIFATPLEDWLLVRPGGEDLPAWPWLAARPSWVPAASPAAPDPEREVVYAAYRSLKPAPVLRFGTLPPAEMRPLEPPVVAGLAWATADFDARRLGPGRHRLSLSGAELTSEVELRIDGPPRSDTLAAPIAPTPTEPPKDLERSYLEALFRLAAGDLAGGRRQVSELEATAFGQGRNGRSGRPSGLVEAELAVAERLVTSRPASLIPLLQLHLDLYRSYQGEGRFLLANHARTLLRELIALFLEQDGPGDSPVQVWIGVAGHLYSGGSALGARQALQEAVAIDGQHPAAVLLLATIHESFGDYAEVVRLLRPLADRADGAHEARLRLAVNLLRDPLGHREGRSRLTACLESDPPEWVATLAAQELANTLVADDQATQALAWLRRTLDRFPHQNRLRLQLAALHDRLGHRQQARELLHGLDPSAGSDRDSPRLRYSRWPAATVQLALANLRREAQDSLLDLADLLAKMPP